MTTNTPKQNKWWRFIIWFFAGLGFLVVGLPVLLGLVVGLSRPFLNTELHWQPSRSMEPTIHGTANKELADRFEINKWAYRSKSPERFDIVLFRPTPELIKESHANPFLYRIVALPGEKVEVKLNQVYINDRPLVEDYLPPKTITATDVCANLQKPFLAEPQTIPPDNYLTLGDNRRSSYDGRCWGTVPKQYIIGKLTKIIKNKN